MCAVVLSAVACAAASEEFTAASEGGKPKPVGFSIDSLKDDKYLDFKRSGTGYEIHDLFTGDRIRHDTLSISVPKHGVKVYRISI